MTALPASTIWAKRYKWRKANGITIYTDVTPIQTHIHNLYKLGVTAAMIADAAGHSDHNIMVIARAENPRVHVDTARRILAVTHHPHPNQTHVLAIGAARRLRALNAIGWPTALLADQLGITSGALNTVTARQRITYQRWAQIRDFYEELSGTPGPNPDTARRTRPKPVPPLAWEGLDIDHPHTQPDWHAAGISKADRPVCVNNHPYTPENTYHDTRGHRQCRKCRRAAEARKTAKRRAA